MIKLGIIDIGTNSTRLMRVYSDGHKEKTLRNVRTGQGVNETKFLQPDAIERTLLAIKEYKRMCGQAPIFCFATSAVRDSSNKREFCDLIKNTLGIKVSVLDGNTEALIGFFGAVPGGDGGVIDIGGGSSEVVRGENAKISYAKSFDIGAVRASEACDSPQKAYDWACELFDKLPSLGQDFTAIGGSATTLAAISQSMDEYQPEKITGFKLYPAELDRLFLMLCGKTLEQRYEIPGLQRHRADIIPYGAAILLAFVNTLNLPFVTISDSDNLEGYLKYINE